MIIEYYLAKFQMMKCIIISFLLVIYHKRPFTIKYGCKLHKMAVYAIVSYRHGDRIDHPGWSFINNRLASFFF